MEKMSPRPRTVTIIGYDLIFGILRWNLRKSTGLTSLTDNVKISANSWIKAITSMHYSSTRGLMDTVLTMASIQGG